ncbi:MAG: hypothetical protein WCN99_06825 [bacterium]
MSSITQELISLPNLAWDTLQLNPLAQNRSFPYLDQIGLLPHLSYRLTKSIPVEVRQEEKSIYVVDRIFHVWGCGESVGEAKLDYGANLVEQLQDLLDHRNALSPLAKARLSLIRQYVKTL